jgi:hypothetical protein
MDIMQERAEMLLENKQAEQSGSSSTYEHFMWMYPFLVAMGLQGTIIGALYSVLNYIYLEIKSRMVSEVHIRYDDDTFLWVNKYL